MPHVCVVSLQERCGTCRLTTRWKWRSWTTRYTLSPTRSWCPTRAGSGGATEREAARKTASPDTWSGKRPSPTQRAAWGTAKTGGRASDQMVLMMRRREGWWVQGSKMEGHQSRRLIRSPVYQRMNWKCLMELRHMMLLVRVTSAAAAGASNITTWGFFPRKWAFVIKCQISPRS